MGLVILVVFLPGVGAGQNFNLFMTFITKPFVVLSQPESPFIIKQACLYLLMTIFIVWSRAQRSAINGGEFALFQDSWPISEFSKNKTNVNMILIGNHLLWPIILASYWYLSSESSLFIFAIINNTVLILLLLITQYIVVFNYSNQKILLLLGIGVVFTTPLSSTSGVYQLTLTCLLLYLFVLRYLFSGNHFSKQTLKLRLFIPSFLTRNFYFQTLFKSGLTSSLFRLAIISGLMFAFTLAINNWVDDYNNLMPYYMVLEALLAYFVSGFYVSFVDQRNTLKFWLITLPIKNSFWVIRDLFSVVVLTTFLHVFFYSWALNITASTILTGVFLYHLLLLIICYPIRVYVVKQQTFITFVVLFIITSITLFNLT